MRLVHYKFTDFIPFLGIWFRILMSGFGYFSRVEHSSLLLHSARDGLHLGLLESKVLSQPGHKIFLPNFACRDVYQVFGTVFENCIFYDDFIDYTVDQFVDKYLGALEPKSVLLVFINFQCLRDDLVTDLRIRGYTVIFDRTNSNFISKPIGSFDIYSLGINKKNGLGFGGLLLTSLELRRFPDRVCFLRLMISLIKGYVFASFAMNALVYAYLVKLKQCFAKGCKKRVFINFDFKPKKCFVFLSRDLVGFLDAFFHSRYNLFSQQNQLDDLLDFLRDSGIPFFVGGIDKPCLHFFLSDQKFVFDALDRFRLAHIDGDYLYFLEGNADFGFCSQNSNDLVHCFIEGL